jgi:hypothetical protein
LLLRWALIARIWSVTPNIPVIPFIAAAVVVIVRAMFLVRVRFRPRMAMRRSQRVVWIVLEADMRWQFPDHNPATAPVIIVVNMAIAVVIDMGVGVIDKFKIDMRICLIIVRAMRVSIFDIGGAAAGGQHSQCERNQYRHHPECGAV